jgi:hypothetical protein
MRLESFFPLLSAAARVGGAGCGIEWWGTWQWDQLPPGRRFVSDFVSATAAAGIRPMFTATQQDNSRRSGRTRPGPMVKGRESMASVGFQSHPAPRALQGLVRSNHDSP